MRGFLVELESGKFKNQGSHKSIRDIIKYHECLRSPSRLAKEMHQDRSMLNQQLQAEWSQSFCPCIVHQQGKDHTTIRQKAQSFPLQLATARLSQVPAIRSQAISQEMAVELLQPVTAFGCWTSSPFFDLLQKSCLCKVAGKLIPYNLTRSSNMRHRSKQKWGQKQHVLLGPNRLTECVGLLWKHIEAKKERDIKTFRGKNISKHFHQTSGLKRCKRSASMVRPNRLWQYHSQTIPGFGFEDVGACLKLF